MIKGTVRASESKSFASIRACRPWRVISAQTWLATILILSSFPNAFAESDFSAFWKKFKVGGYRRRQGGRRGDDEIPTVDVLWGKSREEQGRFPAPL